jgi:hypothetical protein
MNGAISTGEISLKGNSASTARARDAAYKKYEQFCKASNVNFESLETLPSTLYTNNKWWTRLAYYLVEECELKADTAKSYLGYVKDLHFSVSRNNPFWADFETTYAKIRKGK